MKKLVICYWDIGVGGIGSRIRSLLYRLNKRQDVEVVCLFKRARPEYKRLSQLKHVKFCSFSNDDVKGRRLEFLFWLIKNILKEQPTHILGFLNRFALVLALAKAAYFIKGKVVKTILDQPIGTWKYLNQYEIFLWWYPLTVLSFSLANTLTVPTKANYVEIAKYFFTHKKKIQVIPSSVEVSSMKKTPEKKYNAIFVGRLSREKGLETIVETLAYCSERDSNFKMAVLGEGELKEWFLTEIARRNLGKYLDYLGFRLDSRKYIRSANVLLLPSYNEGLPMVILEAYAEAVPVIVTPYEGVKEVVLHQQTGLVVARSNFAKRVAHFLRDKKTVRKMGRQAHLFVKQNFSPQNLELFIETIFNE